MRPPGGKPTVIQLTINSCVECPKVKSARTPGAGYAIDYFCSLVKDEQGEPKEVMGYIEWPSEHREPPKWCPLRVDKQQPDVLEPESRFSATAEEL